MPRKRFTPEQEPKTLDTTPSTSVSPIIILKEIKGIQGQVVGAGGMVCAGGTRRVPVIL
jgi:hypothetical protein